MNVYIFGSSGQDGTLLAAEYKNDTTPLNLILVSSRSVSCITKSSAKYSYYTTNSDLLRLIDSLFCSYPPSYIYYFAAVHTSSFEVNLVETNQSFVNCELPLKLASMAMSFDHEVKFFYASSCLIFGESNTSPQNEDTERSPICPYSISKLRTEESLTTLLRNSSVKYFVGILYNHESHLRKPHFFTRKLLDYALSASRSLATGRKPNCLTLYNPLSLIDIGYSQEFVKISRMLAESNSPSGSYIISTGELISIRESVDYVCSYFGIDNNLVDYKTSTPRSPTVLCGDNSKLLETLGCTPKLHTFKLFNQLCFDYAKLKLND